MSTTFDSVVSNPGSGGESWAVEKFTNGSDTISMPVCAIAFGVDGGPFTLVGDDSVANLPIKVNWPLPTGTNTIGSVKVTDGTLTASIRDTGTNDSLNVAIVDASGNQITSFGSGADVGATGSAVPASGSYQGINVAGTLRGQTGVNPSGSIYATQIDIASIGGTSVGSALAVSQSGTWNITNISGTISLPSGASTAAKQPALGVAGTASSDVLTVQGIASMTPLLATLSGTNTITSITNVVHVDDNSGSLTVDGTVAATQSGTWNITNVSGTISLPTGASTESSLAKLTISQGAALGSNTQILTGGSVTTAAPSYTTGQVSPLSLTTAGALRVDSSAVTQPVSGNVASGATDSGNPVKIGGKYNSGGITLTDGQRGDLQLDSSGQLKVATSISSVTVSTMPGGLTAYAEDSAHVDGDKGLLVLAVRKDTPASTSGTAGDYSGFTTDSVGRLWTTGAQQGSVTQTFARPANTTAYTAGDLAGDTTATVSAFQLSNVVPYNGGSGLILSCVLEMDHKSVTPRFRVHLFNASDPTLVADNAALKLLDSERAKYITYFDMPALITPADTTNSTLSFAVRNDLREPFICAASSTSLWYALEVLDAYTPASGENIRLRLNVRPD